MIQRSSFPKIARTVASTVLCASSTLFFVLSSSEPSPAQQGRFFCGRSGGEYVTYARNSQGAFPMIRWTKWSPGQWTHRERCLSIAQRFNRFWANGSPQLRAGRMNNYPVICRVNSAGSCAEVAIVFPRDENPSTYLQQLKSIPFSRGIETWAVQDAPFSYDASGYLTINLRNYLNLNGLPTEDYRDVTIITQDSEIFPAQPDQEALFDFEIID